jgi:hypothetical protein
MYSYTGTMQQGGFFIPVEGEPVFLVRRSYEVTAVTNEKNLTAIAYKRKAAT